MKFLESIIFAAGLFALGLALGIYIGQGSCAKPAAVKPALHRMT